MMLKTAGTFLLKVASKKGWEYLTEKDLDSILDNVFEGMSKENRNYNKVFGNNTILLREVFCDDKLLKSIGNFLINEGSIFDSDNIKIIEMKIDQSKIKISDIKEMLQDFQKHILLNLSLNPKICNNFLVMSVFDLSQNQKEILQILNEGVQIVGDEETEGYADVGGITQFRILAYSFNEFIKEIKKFLDIRSSSKFLSLDKISDEQSQALYQNCSSKKSFEITDSPFKIIYPNISRVKIWFKKKYLNQVEMIEISVFCSTPNIINKLAYLFFSCIPSYGTIQKGHFHKKMKKLVTEVHSHSVYAIKFDPDITQEIKDAGIPKNIRVSEETFFGDPGLPKLKEIESALSKLKEFNNDGTSKIQFFKSKKDAKLIKGALTTFALSSDGRLLAWFRKNQFDDENGKHSALYEWYLKNADFNLITPRKRSVT